MSPRIILSLWLGPLYPFAAAHPILFTAAALVVIWLCTMLGQLIAKLLIAAGIVISIAAGIVISIAARIVMSLMRKGLGNTNPASRKPNRKPKNNLRGEI